jgi:hypothetical protein
MWRNFFSKKLPTLSLFRDPYYIFYSKPSVLLSRKNLVNDLGDFFKKYETQHNYNLKSLSINWTAHRPNNAFLTTLSEVSISNNFLFDCCFHVITFIFDLFNSNKELFLWNFMLIKYFFFSLHSYFWFFI